MHDSDSGPLLTPQGGATDPPADTAQEALPGAPDSADENTDSFTALRDNITSLFDDARTYAEAEIAFQRTRAELAGKAAGRALLLLVLAVVLLHIALIALAVGAVIALAPLVSIWGAIAIVVGILLVGVVTLAFIALGDGKTLAAMFRSGDRQ